MLKDLEGLTLKAIKKTLKKIYFIIMILAIVTNNLYDQIIFLKPLVMQLI
jgi:hypothetical protein